MAEATQQLAIQPIESRLAEFAKYVDEIWVKTRDEYAAITLRVQAAKQEVKKIGFVLDPGIASAKEHYDFLRNQKREFVDKWNVQIEIGDRKAKQWLEDDERKRRQEQEAEQEKVRAAQRIKAEEERKEQDRIIEENRKAREREIEEARKDGDLKKREADRLKKQSDEDAERQRELAKKQEQETIAATPVVEVESSRPRIAGVPRTMHYYAEVKDPNLLFIAFEEAIRSGNAKRQLFLRRFLTINEQEVGKYARETKDSATVNGTLPGVLATNSF